MQFSEKELVHFLTETLQGLSFLYKKETFGYRHHLRRSYNIEKERIVEFDHGNQTGRIDAHVTTDNNRIHLIIEAKITADLTAISQVLRYKRALTAELVGSHNFRSESGDIREGYFTVRAAIAAQFFTDECLILCEELGILCFLIVPINKNRALFKALVEATRENKIKQHKSLHKRSLWRD